MSNLVHSRGEPQVASPFLVAADTSITRWLFCIILFCPCLIPSSKAHAQTHRQNKPRIGCGLLALKMAKCLSAGRWCGSLRKVSPNLDTGMIGSTSHLPHGIKTRARQSPDILSLPSSHPTRTHPCTRAGIVQLSYKRSLASLWRTRPSPS